MPGRRGPQGWEDEEDTGNLYREDPRNIRLSLSMFVFFFTNACSWSITTAVPAMYSGFESQFALTSLELSALRALLSLCQFGTAPAWAYFASKYSKKRMLWVQCLLGSLFCFLTSFPQSYRLLLLTVAGAGLSNGGIFPIIQSIVADLYLPHQRGRLYGLLNVATFVGVAFGFVFPTNVPYQVTIGQMSFRLVFLVLSGCLLVAAILNIAFAEEPTRPRGEPSVPMWAQVKAICHSRTWVLIVLQGCFGMIPWDAISFLILWFEFVGFSKSSSGLIMLCAAVGAAAGAVFGGWLGDKAARWSPNRGRLAMAQFSIIMAMPLSYVYLNVIPQTSSSEALYMLAGFGMAFFCNWVGPGCNEVIISEVVLESHRTVAFSIDRLFEGSCSAMGSIFVGGVAQIYGYSYPSQRPISQLDQAVRDTNTAALADALTLCCTIFWFISALVFLFIPRHYPHDRERIESTPKPSYSRGYAPITTDAF